LARPDPGKISVRFGVEETKRGSMVHDDGEDRPTSALGAMTRELERSDLELVRAAGLDARNTEGAAERAEKPELAFGDLPGQLNEQLASTSASTAGQRAPA
jgi:hypothetical protein